MENQPLVSIIIPCYNYGCFLGEALRSVISQTYYNWECFVVDDGSLDNTREVALSFSKGDLRIKYFFQNNSGLASARNFGIKLAKGEFLQFLDADDLLQSRKIESQVSFLTSNPQANIVYCDVRYFFNQETEQLFFSRGKENKKWMPYLSGSGQNLKEAFVNGNIIELGAALFRIEDIRQIGFFDPRWPAIADWEFCLRAALLGLNFQFLELPNGMLLMRNHESMSKNRNLMWKDAIKARRTLSNRLKDKNLKKTNRQKISDLLERSGYAFLNSGLIFKGRWLIFIAGFYRRNLNTILRSFCPEKRLIIKKD